MLHLASNNEITSHKDDPTHLFHVLLTCRANAQTEEDKENAMLFATTQKSKEITTLIQKHPDIMDIMTTLHQYQLFVENPITPAQLLQSKQVIWGFLQPFILGGIKQIFFLSSSLPKPLAKRNMEPMSDIGISNRLILIAEDAYITHLRRHINFFHTATSDQWPCAFRHYRQEVLERVQAYVDDIAQGNMPTSYKEACSLLVPKLRKILVNKSMSGAPWLPQAKLFTPLFCPQFLLDLFQELMSHSASISLVSFFILQSNLTLIH